MINGLKVGRFGFFRDADLTLRLDESNLYDQIDADGWVSVWFGGRDIYLPEYGDFSVFLSCGVTFFWDVLDGDGNRTKDGFTEMLIPYNPHMEPYSGDIIPLNPIDVFGERTTTPKMICSNLWFYTNLFRDQYYRYNLIVLNSSTSSGWPDEANSKIIPMNENVVLEPGDFIVGYRPKPEYMNQLAVVKNVMSGRDNAILFKFKVDLDYLADNPEEERILKFFSMSDDVSEFLVYPNQIDNVNWGTHKVPYMDEYNRYLLYHGIEMYSPSENELRWAHELYEKFMYISNRILIMDPYNESRVIYDVDRIMGGEKDIKLVGFSYSVIPIFLEWIAENSTVNVPTETMGILRRVVLTTKYFKGFSKLDTILGDMVTSIAESSGNPSVHDGNTEVVDGQRVIANGGENYTYIEPISLINIVMEDGVRVFSNGHAPTSAKDYRYPDENGDYRYAGHTGNGLYKITIAGQIRDVFCDMDNGGWMYLIVSGNDTEYMTQFCDLTAIAPTRYYDETYGIGWAKNDGISYNLQFYNLPFTDVRAQLSGDHDNPVSGKGYLEVHTGANGNIIYFTDGDTSGNAGQDIIVDGVTVLAGDKTDLTNFQVEYNGTNDGMNNLVVKMNGDSDAPYCKRYIRMLCVR